MDIKIGNNRVNYLLRGTDDLPGKEEYYWSYTSLKTQFLVGLDRKTAHLNRLESESLDVFLGK